MAVPSPLSTRVIPAGRAPVSVMAGTGARLVLTTKPKVAPVVALAVAALVTVGAAVMVIVKDCVVEPASLTAVNVSWYTPPVPVGFL